MRLCALVLAVSLMIGCGGAGSTVTAANKDRIKTGMSEAEVVAILGPPTAVVLEIGPEKAVQWTGGTADNPSVIAVNFSSGKVKLVTAANL